MRRAEVYRYVFTNRYEDGRVEISKIHLSTFLSLSVWVHLFPYIPQDESVAFFFPLSPGISIVLAFIVVELCDVTTNEIADR